MTGTQVANIKAAIRNLFEAALLAAILFTLLAQHRIIREQQATIQKLQQSYQKLDQDYMQEMGLRDEADTLLRTR